MSNRPTRITLNFLLSVAVLAWGFIPPAVRHSHLGGDDTSHRHGIGSSRDADHDRHPHDGDNEHHNPRPTPQPTYLVLADVVHLHFVWCGLEFAVPESDNPDQGPNGTNGVELLVVGATSDLVPHIQHKTESDSLRVPTAQGTSVESAIALLSVGQSPPPVTTVPLCDSARFERSGVLLA